HPRSAPTRRSSDLTPGQALFFLDQALLERRFYGRPAVRYAGQGFAEHAADRTAMLPRRCRGALEVAVQYRLIDSAHQRVGFSGFLRDFEQSGEKQVNRVYGNEDDDRKDDPPAQQ